MSSKGNRAGIWLLMVAMVLGWSAIAESAPPWELLLEATGGKAEERRELVWSLTLVEQGITELKGKDSDDGEAMRFAGGGREVDIFRGAEAPWGLVWAVLWSRSPEQEVGREFGEATGRVEVVGGEVAYCYGGSAQICVDKTAQVVLKLSIDAGGARWELRTSRQGSRVQITRDGALFARFEGSESSVEAGR